MVIVVILFLIGFVLISKGADFFINATVEIGRKTNISELILGATIVSFATTLPELTVSLFASIDNHTTMSLGNAVGSIINNKDPKYVCEFATCASALKHSILGDANLVELSDVEKLMYEGVGKIAR